MSGSVCLGLLGFLPLDWSVDQLGKTRKTNTLASKLANVYVDKTSAKIVGLEYLQSAPSEAKAGLLIDLICSFDREQRDEFARADKQQLMELLRLQQCQDFEYGRVVNVRGWILSRTECRLCALAALS